MYLIIYLTLVVVSFIIVTIVTREVRKPSPLPLNMGEKNEIIDMREITYLEWYYVFLLSIFFPVTILVFLIKKLHYLLVHFNV